MAPKRLFQVSITPSTEGRATGCALATSENAALHAVVRDVYGPDVRVHHENTGKVRLDAAGGGFVYASTSVRRGCECVIGSGLSGTRSAARRPARARTETIDLGNNESISRGVFKTPDGYTATTFTQSKSFKTRAGAERWLSRKLGAR